MDPRLEAILVLSAGFVIRIALPLLLTALIVLFLRQLDARWTEEAEALEPQETGAGTGERQAQPQGGASRTPCWEVRDCPPERREGCPAYARQGVPCWQVFRSREGALKEDCLGCAVFHNAPIPLAAAD